MVMMISKFHGMIRSRLVWMIILGVIIVSFVGLYVKQSFTSGTEEAAVAGRLAGEAVSHEQYAEAYDHMRLAFNLRFGQPLPRTARIEKELRRQAWRHLAALQEARRMGLAVEDQEVVQSLQSNPSFVEEGRFDPRRYQAFLQGLFEQLAASDMYFPGRTVQEQFGHLQRLFEQYVREEILLQKLRIIVQQVALVSPEDLQRTLKALTDVFDVEYAVLSLTNIERDVRFTMDDAREFFLKDPAAFTLPEQVWVKYIQVPVSNYVETANVTEEEALEYYNDRLDEYQRPVAETNAAAGALGLSNETARLEAIPFDEVKTNILRELKGEQARVKASEVATDFVVALAPDRDGKAASFEEAAAQLRFPVLRAGPLDRATPAPGIEAGPEFNQAVFALDEPADENFTDAIMGSNYIYVAALEKKMAPRVPAFDEISNGVFRVARQVAVETALTNKAAVLRGAIERGMAQGKTFAAMLKPFSLKSERTGEFSISEGMSATNAYTETLLRGIVTRNAGELTDVLPAEDGVVLAYVVQRRAEPGAAAGELMTQIIGSVKRQRGQVLFDDLQNYLMRPEVFEDRLTRAAEEEEEEPVDTNAFGAVEDTAPAEQP